MPNKIEQATALLNSSYYEGLLSPESAKALAALPQHPEEIAAALGSDATGTDVMLVTILVDDSLSIRDITSGRQAEERGHDRLLEVLGRRTETNVLVHTRLLNRGSFSPYSSLQSARNLREHLHLSPDGTPLYRQSLLTLGSVMAKSLQLEQQGKRVRTVTLIITDGDDNRSGHTTATHVRFWVQDMMVHASNHIIAGMGIGATYARVFRDMGIPKAFIFKAGATAEEINKMFDSFEKTVLLPAAASEGSFRQLVAGSSEGD